MISDIDLIKAIAFMRLAGLPFDNDTFNTQYGDFIFNIETSGVSLDIPYFFRYNVSTRIDNRMIIYHIYEETKQMYLEISLFNVAQFVEGSVRKCET